MPLRPCMRSTFAFPAYHAALRPFHAAYTTALPAAAAARMAPLPPGVGGLKTRNEDVLCLDKAGPLPGGPVLVESDTL
eukprot:12257143-Alexandrium_andersonii.AAC.1